MNDALAPPTVTLQGVFNFRDFGGHPAAGGGRVRLGRLYRSAHHAGATEADQTALGALDLALIADLRKPGERRRDPARRPHAFRGQVIAHGAEAPENEPPHLAFLADPEARADAVFARMVEVYRSFPFDPHCAPVYRDYFQALAEVDGAALVHCHAGKDRTGLLCALTLHALGVERAAIYDDYLATNRSPRIDLRMEALVERFEREHGRPIDAALLGCIQFADRRYLEAAFEEIEARHGDVDGYLDAVLGVTPAMQARLRERLLA